jgi:tRNA uridine 5-carboxymethylaminomethyl modification enzyme
MREAEVMRISEPIDYTRIPGLRAEAAQKLSATRPATIGQAGRISGVSPADISILMVHVHAGGRATRLESGS